MCSCQGAACAVRALPSGAAWLLGTFASFNHTLSAAFFEAFSLLPSL